MISDPVYFRVIIAVIILCIALCILFGFYGKWETIGETVLITVFAVAILCCFKDTYRLPSGRYRYDVIFDNDYDLTQVYQNYDVVMQRGLLWQIEDKS